MMKISRLNKKFFFKGLLPFAILISLVFNPIKAFAEIAETEINGELINASSEFLRDLDFETWQLVAYKSPFFEDKLILRVIGFQDIQLPLRSICLQKMAIYTLQVAMFQNLDLLETHY